MTLVQTRCENVKEYERIPSPSLPCLTIPHQVSNALMGVVTSLPGSTRVFCGHEYTVSNLQFAKSVEPESSAVTDKLDWSRKILAQGGYTVPSTVSAWCGRKSTSAVLVCVFSGVCITTTGDWSETLQGQK